MNGLDIVLSIILAAGLIRGFQKGFIRSVSGLLAIGLAIWIGFNFSNLLEDFVARQELIPKEFVRILSLILTIALVILAIKILSKILHEAVHTVGLGFFNRLGGAFSGFLLHLLVLSLLVYYLYPFLKKIPDESMWDESRLVPYLRIVAGVMKISFL